LSPTAKALGHQAVVIGGSIAGLMAARVLTDYFDRVTIVERDRLPANPDFRRGVPHARHAHVLRLRGQMILEQHFPGLVAELLANGAVSINAGNEAEFFLFGRWRGPAYHSAIVSIASSRPLLEALITRRLAAHPGVTLLQEHDVIGLSGDGRGERVTGVRLRRWDQAGAGEIDLAADLVVDASGRGSKAPEWLASLGFAPPRETVVNAFPGYTTRLYRRPAGWRGGWKTLNIIPTPPHNSHGGVIVPLEGGRWQVSLVGMGRDYPPTDEEGFLNFARSLPSPRLYEAIKDAEPLTKPIGFWNNENRLRHYEQLPRYLEGFLATGDSVCILNPTHAQGMTVAALGSLALDRCLQARRRGSAPGDLTGLARAFQQELSQVMTGPWLMATSTDRRWPATEGAADRPNLMTQLRQMYFAWVLRAMVHNPQVAEVFFHVQHMVTPPTALFRRDIVLQVLGLPLRRPRPAPGARPGATSTSSAARPC
jgi:2-polyprenyl-6-methoxyphenol hydroxylase-like FAD-dependent oxidoreductase